MLIACHIKWFKCMCIMWREFQKTNFILYGKRTYFITHKWRTGYSSGRDGINVVRIQLTNVISSIQPFCVTIKLLPIGEPWASSLYRWYTYQKCVNAGCPSSRNPEMRCTTSLAILWAVVSYRLALWHNLYQCQEQVLGVTFAHALPILF